MNQWTDKMAGETRRWMDGWMDGHIGLLINGLGSIWTRGQKALRKKHAEGLGYLAEPVLRIASRYLVVPCPTFLAQLFITPIETVRLPVTDPGQ